MSTIDDPSTSVETETGKVLEAAALESVAATWSGVGDVAAGLGVIVAAANAAAAAFGTVPIAAAPVIAAANVPATIVPAAAFKPGPRPAGDANEKASSSPLPESTPPTMPTADSAAAAVDASASAASLPLGNGELSSWASRERSAAISSTIMDTSDGVASAADDAGSLKGTASDRRPSAERADAGVVAVAGVAAWTASAAATATRRPP